MKLQYQIPPIYRSVFPESLLELDPVETKATCENCAKSPGRTRSKETYDKDLKCCTFHPWLPNFAVGALLREPSAPAILREKIRTRDYSLPIGLAPSIRYQVEFNSRKKGEFGNREDWLCPYYDRDKKMCGVWRHRGAVCTSYYCKSDQGAAGKRFWRSLESYIFFLEMSYMEEALVHLDFSPRQISDLLGYLNRTDGTVKEKSARSLPEKKARELWNGYYDDQELFFDKCLRVVESMTPAQSQELLGETGEFLLQSVLADARCFH